MKPARKAVSYRRPKSVAVRPRSALRIDRYLREDHAAQLAGDVRSGLTATPKRLSPKYFYDERGSRLFEAICELPEYYLTRTEHGVLAEIAPVVIAKTQPAQLVELGSGASRKTRLLLDALVSARSGATYVPIDVSETILRQSAAALRAAYPTLDVRAIVADYDRGLPPLGGVGPRLVAFLGSTIGNFVPPDDVTFLRGLSRQLTAGDYLLLGVDLVKSAERLHAAYNDAAGVTAEFNRNVLHVLNRELGANFDPARFEHVAFYDPERAQIEMHLRAREAQTVRIAALDLTIAFAAGETIHTESSRKFTRATATAMLESSGFALRQWFRSRDGAFALALASVEDAA
jgi:L-histidine Nalpha-methyltransferase